MIRPAHPTLALAGLAGLAGLAALQSACAGPPVAEPAAGSGQAAITGGVAEGGYDAVFALAYQGEGGCTGTCITPRVGTTAAHCVEGDPASSFTALFGAREDAPEAIVQVTAMAAAPDGGDLALVAFADVCPATIPFNRAALEDHVGEPVVMVGFGVTTEEAGDAGVKRSGTATLFSVDPAEVPGLEADELATSNDPAGTCNGDSGGPTFMTFDGRERMVGATARGSLVQEGGTEEWPCGQGRSIAVRTDRYSSFIDDFIAAHDPGAVPDGGDGGDGDGDDDDDGGGGGGGEDEDEDGGGGGGGGGVTMAGCQAGGPAAGPGAALLGLGLIALRRRRRPRARATRRRPGGRCPVGGGMRSSTDATHRGGRARATRTDAGLSATWPSAPGTSSAGTSTRRTCGPSSTRCATS